MLLKWLKKKILGYTPRDIIEFEGTGDSEELANTAALKLLDAFDAEMNAEIDFEEFDRLFTKVLDALAYSHLPGWQKDFIQTRPDLKKLADLLQDEVDRVLHPVEAVPVKVQTLSSITDILIDIVED